MHHLFRSGPEQRGTIQCSMINSFSKRTVDSGENVMKGTLSRCSDDLGAKCCSRQPTQTLSNRGQTIFHMVTTERDNKIGGHAQDGTTTSTARMKLHESVLCEAGFARTACARRELFCRFCQTDGSECRERNDVRAHNSGNGVSHRETVVQRKTHRACCDVHQEEATQRERVPSFWKTCASIVQLFKDDRKRLVEDDTLLLLNLSKVRRQGPPHPGGGQFQKIQLWDT